MHDQRSCAKSDNSPISRISLAAALAFLTLILSACPTPGSSDHGPNPIPTDLSVTETIPADGATGFDPGQAIVVKFNKDLDPACLPQSPVDIAPNTLNDGSPITLTFSYHNPTKKLSIEPHPFLESNHTYTVSFETTLQDASGGTLPKQVDLSFTTGNKLAGDIEIVAGNTYNGKQYTNADKVTLYLRHNNASPVRAHIAKSEAELSTNPLWDEDVSPITNIVDWPLDPNVQGPQTFYVQYLYSSQISAIRSATIVYDRMAPQIDPQPNVAQYYNMYNVPSNPEFVPFVASCSATDPGDAPSGIAAYTWTADPVLHFDGSGPSQALTIDGPDASYNVRLTVTDRAGNQSFWPPLTSPTFTICKDTVKPGQPIEPDPDPTTQSPYLFQSGIQWYWLGTASSNSDGSENTFRVSRNGATVEPTLLPQPHYGPITVESDGLYTLSIEQVDKALNVSEARVVSIKVVPLLPDDGSTVGTTGILEWRDFFPEAPDRWKYWVHVWPDGSDPANTPPIEVPSGTRYCNYGFPAGKYDWYVIKWDTDTYEQGNHVPDNRLYNQFTVH